MSESVYPCEGCRRESPTGELKEAWISTPLGLRCIYAHPGCERAAIEVAEKGSGGRVRVVERPRTREERDRDAARR